MSIDLPPPFVGGLFFIFFDLLFVLFVETVFRGDVFAAAAPGHEERAEKQGHKHEWEVATLEHECHFKEMFELREQSARRCYGNWVLSPPAMVPALVQTSASTDSVTNRVLPSARQTFAPPGW